LCNSRLTIDPDYPPSSDPLLTPSKEIVIEEVERGIARTVRELKTVLEWEERNAVKEGNKLSRYVCSSSITRSF
jgi:cell pole-organizing protein PopZ